MNTCQTSIKTIYYYRIAEDPSSVLNRQCKKHHSGSQRTELEGEALLEQRISQIRIVDRLLKLQ